ncbi:MAG TPA: RNA-binding protein, partial [Kofleriaceae bacterium]|nr:RNA-binding protein [Kofleriaceae bacterium]
MSKLYVGNLSYSTTDETLRQVFEEDGRQVTSVAVITDRETGQSRGFAFVEMGSPADAEAAIAACDGRDVDGRRLRVN